MRLYKIGKFIELKSRNCGYQGMGKENKVSYCSVGTEFLFGMMEKFWKWMKVMVTPHCEHI